MAMENACVFQAASLVSTYSTWQYGSLKRSCKNACFTAGFVACAMEGSSLSCDFYGITQKKPVFSIQLTSY